MLSPDSLGSTAVSGKSPILGSKPTEGKAVYGVKTLPVDPDV